jgi:hypothetical protein
MPGGGTRLGEEVRDGPHNNNRCGGNRCGVASTAAPLSARVGPGLSGFGLYNVFWPRFPNLPSLAQPLLCVLDALRGTSGGETMTTAGGAGTTPRPGV